MPPFDHPKAVLGLLLMSAGLAVATIASCKTTPPEGISVICESNGDNEYVLVRGPYFRVKNPPIFKCYGKDEWLDDGTGGETGDAEETDGMVASGIDRETWPTHSPSLAHIKAYCTDQCKAMGDGSGETPTCEDDNWLIYGYDGVNQISGKVPATALVDPSALNCDPPASRGKKKRDPAESKVVLDDAAVWPSDREPIALACDTVRVCAALFDGNVMAHLGHSSPTLPGDDEAAADYSVTIGAGSSALTLRIANSDNPSEASNWVDGRIEYTAPDCGQPTCPFYLGNITVTNTSDTWDLHSEALNADVEIANLHVRLRGPTLGVWRPSTGEVYLDAQMLDLRVDFDLAMLGEPASTVSRYVTNDDGIFGIRHRNAGIEFVDLSINDGDMEANATLNYGSVDRSPSGAGNED
jgi:hypothetical protein